MTKLRVHASYLRKRFEKSSELIQEIVCRMSDEELVEAEARHHEMHLHAILDKTRRAIARSTDSAQGRDPMIGPAQCKNVKRRWFGLRRG